MGRADSAARPGEVVNVYDKHEKLFGRGLYNPRSRITLRMLCHDDTPVDDTFWKVKLARAINLRRTLRIEETSDAYRLVHAEGDELSGLIVERYGECLVFELFSLGMYRIWRQIAGWIAELLGPPTSLDHPIQSVTNWRLLARADENVERNEGFHVSPADRGGIGRIVIREHGIRYRVDPAGGHKTGFFCDQRDNRKRFASFCRDATVLDLCCYTGGFGLCAKLLGQAVDVTSVDLDEEALALAKENANLNQAKINTVHSDVFPYIRQMQTNGRQYDAVVLDPPKLALSRDELMPAIKKYHDLNHLAVQVVRPGGLFLTCSCSGLVHRGQFLETVHAAARRARRRLQLLEQSGAASDHPIMLNCPESEYLKACWFRVLA